MLIDWFSFSCWTLHCQREAVLLNRLNRKVEYSLIALKLMASKRAGELTSAKEIVERTGVPFDAMARVLQRLAQRGLLKSEYGAHGGYLLIRDLARVSYFELSEIILGPVAMAKCLKQSSVCPLKLRCNLVSPMATLNRRLTEFYRGLTVGEILRLKEMNEPSVSISQLVEAVN